MTRAAHQSVVDDINKNCKDTSWTHRLYVYKVLYWDFAELS